MKREFSVLMANYNNGKYVAEAIESVISQTFKNWELVIIDDCSTDNSVEIIKSYQDERIRFFHNEKNAGKIGVLKKAVALARAEIIGILDSDDVLAENALEEIIKAYQEYPERGFVYSQFVFCDKNLNSVKNGLCKPMPPGQSNLFDLYTVAFRTYRKSCYYKTTGYDDEILYAEDRDIILKMEEVTKFYFVDKILYKYRRLPDSQTTNPKKFEINRASCALAEYKAYLRRQNTDLPNLSKSEIAFRMLSVFPLCFKIGDYKRAKFFLLTSLRLCPFNFYGYYKFAIKIFKYPFKKAYYKIFGFRDPLSGVKTGYL